MALKGRRKQKREGRQKEGVRDEEINVITKQKRDI
jgi:hypothetical protein